MSAAEIVLTTLHAGGKFGGKGYQVSGGLHGVGVSVVNALSTRLVLEIDRDGQHWEAEFDKGGKVKRKIAATGPAPLDRSTGEPRTGTTVTFWPDATVFDETEFRAQTIIERMQIMAFLNKGLEIRFTDERTDPELKTTFKYAGGIVDFVKHLNASKESLFRKVASFEQVEEGQEVEIALQWNTGFHESIHSFANGISTIEGGMHEEGFSKALTNAVNRYARARNLLKEKEENLKGEDIREGLTAIISVRLRDPQFEGQTKAKLGNVTIRSLVERATNEKLAEWLEENPREANQIVQKSTAGGPGPHGRAGRPRPDPAQVRPRRGRPARASWPTARRATRASRSSSSSRGTRPAVRPRTPATRAPRPSCPSGARSSTSSGPASTRC